MRRIRSELILSYMQENKLNKGEFCKLCDISMISLNKLLHNDFKINTEVVLKVIKVLGITMDDFLELE
ncbi:MAG: helix-turn-helix domain-containing protein [Clostridia bacterium]|nr:helix-turn-helix domain-containing protein [Clostridia bacterium]